MPLVTDRYCVTKRHTKVLQKFLLCGKGHLITLVPPKAGCFNFIFGLRECPKLKAAKRYVEVSNLAVYE